MPRGPAAQVWQRLVAEAGDALVEQAARVSVVQAERELAAAGFDVAAERRHGEALVAALASPRSRRGRG